MTGKADAKRILVMDDDDDLASTLCILLKHNGYSPRRAVDGQQGLQMAAEERPDLILLDFMMPVMSGFDVCMELAANPSLCDVPVIVLTAFGQDIGVVHGLTSGTTPSCIRDYIEKPFEVNVLMERVGLAIACREA